MIKRFTFHVFVSIATLLSVVNVASAQLQRAPAYPLITHDPYFSVWSFTDSLNAKTTTHWTGQNQSLMGMITVDGKTYRFLGQEEKSYLAIAPASDEASYTAQYTEDEPGEGWMNPDFNDSQWKNGKAPFGSEGEANTKWEKKDIWMRRVFTSDKAGLEDLYLKAVHDDNCDIYLNGKKIYSSGLVNKFKYTSIKEKLNQGRNVLAIHGVNTGGLAWLDVGLVTEMKNQSAQDLKAEQKSVEVTATQTIYNFNCGPVKLKLTFTSPLLLNNLSLLSRPVSYITFSASSGDGAVHNTKLFLGASTNIAVNTTKEDVVATKYKGSNLFLLKAGTVEQPILKKKGDDLRIDWGYMYVAAPQDQKAEQSITTAKSALSSFLQNGKSSLESLSGRELMLNTVYNLGAVGKTPKERFLLMGYDDLYSIQYFGQNLQPWWKEGKDTTMISQLAKASVGYKQIMQQCTAFDAKMYSDAKRIGGDEYAKICVAAYRQSIAAHKLVKSPAGEILFLSKENFSNGSINTVDVTYPSAPLYLLYNPELLKGMLNGIFYYSESGMWKKPFAAHDLGTYPLANGQTYGEDMPVEESGNMLILTGAITKAEGNVEYARKHWQTLTEWAEYLSKEGFDPDKQLCTDDFAGHLARNANLSVKAIIGLRCYAMLAEMLNQKETAEKYKVMTAEMVQKWMKLADVGDHYALTFNDKKTWSQKYNLVWDKVLGFDLFPKEVYDKEVALYLTKQNGYGLPLDSRKTYTKSDWILWTATLADNPKDFEALMNPVYKFVTETTSRVPLSDWHETETSEMSGFQARSVVGGYFMKLLQAKLNTTNKEGKKTIKDLQTK